MKQERRGQLNLFWLKIVIAMTFFICSFYYRSMVEYAMILKGIAYFILLVELLGEFFYSFLKKQENTVLYILLVSFVMIAIGKIDEAILLFFFYQVMQYFTKKIFRKMNRFHLGRQVVIVKKDHSYPLDILKIKKNMILLFSQNEIVPVVGILESKEGNFESLDGTKKVSLKKGDKVSSGMRCLTDRVVIQSKENYKESTWRKMQERLEKQHQILEKQMAYYVSYKKNILLLFGLFCIFVPNFLTGKIQFQFIYVGAGLLLFISLRGISKNILHLQKKMTFDLLVNDIGIRSFENFRKFYKVKNIIFEKTGILTLGEFRITGIHTVDEEKFFKYLNYVEYYSEHSIAKTIRSYKKVEIDVKRIKDFHEVYGRGVECKVGKEQIVAGNLYFLKDKGISFDPENAMGTVIYLVIGKKCVGNIVLSDSIKCSIKSLISELRGQGIQNISVLSGDNEVINKGVCQELGIVDQYSNLTPNEKGFWLKHLKEYYKGYTMIVGNANTKENMLDFADFSLILNKDFDILEKGDFYIFNDHLEALSSFFDIIKNYRLELHRILVFYICLIGICCFGLVFSVLPLYSFVFISYVTEILIDIYINRKKG